MVDYTELTSGLSVLCGGDRDDKVSAAFALFDVNGDGFITKDEMVTYLVSVFKLLYATQPDLETRIGVGPEELGQATALQAFEEHQDELDNTKKMVTALRERGERSRLLFSKLIQMQQL